MTELEFLSTLATIVIASIAVAGFMMAQIRRGLGDRLDTRIDRLEKQNGEPASRVSGIEGFIRGMSVAQPLS